MIEMFTVMIGYLLATGMAVYSITIDSGKEAFNMFAFGYIMLMVAMILLRVIE